MNMKEKVRVTYETPNINVIGARTEGILCQSPPWYEKGGQGDYSYNTETDNTWA